MNPICCIFGASTLDEHTKIDIEAHSLVIAADGGLIHLKRLEITPDVVIGDFDSLGYIPNLDNVIPYDSNKDDTDLMLAVKYGLEQGYRDFRIFGALGGRVDHTYSNIQTLKYLSLHGASGWLIDGKTRMTVISDTWLKFNSNQKGTVSVFTVGEKATGVDICGLKYTLDDACLVDSFPLGISNELIGTDSQISVEDGSLLIIHIDE
ncbi:MAG: thiamine diphosphokinase [Oscillospiraceae bacterium]|nr:thiamine diphosphokinase [Oscillospiraceae bacterium]